MIKKSVLLSALAIAGFAVTSLAQTVPNYVPTNGLVGWWPFNGNAIDESVNTNDGTVNGATLTADRFGNANAAYSFDGINDFISISNSSSLASPTSSITLSAWFNVNNWDYTFSASTGYASILCKSTSSSSTQYRISVAKTLTNNVFTIIFNGTEYLWNLPLNTIQSGTYYHVAFAFSSSAANLYLNGVLKNSFNSQNSFPANATMNLEIGRDQAGSTDYINGKLDDIGIWNRTLTQQEITGLYNGNICYQTITVTDTLLINTNFTGFNPVTYQNTIKIWPNPTNDHITIDNGNLANLTGHQIKISNALGQQVFQSAITQQQFYVDMSTWGGNGIYFVNLINAQGVTIETRKIMLQ
jgi:hypothetical protein